MSRRRPPKVPEKKLMYAGRYSGNDGRLYTRPSDAAKGADQLVVYELVEVAVLQLNRRDGAKGVRLKNKPSVKELVAAEVERVG